MFVVLTRSWDNSWYNCHETLEEAKQEFDSSSAYYPNCWLIEGNIKEVKTYSNIGIDKLPY